MVYNGISELLADLKMKRLLLDVEYKLVQSEICRLYKKAAKLWPEHAEKFSLPDLEFSNRLKTTAGYAYFESNKIKLSWELYRLNRAEFYRDTIAHEVAHLIAWHVYNDAGHGKGWKFTFWKLSGQKPERLHTMYTRKNLPDWQEFLQ